MWSLNSAFMRVFLILAVFCCALKAQTRDSDAFSQGLGLLQSQKYADAVSEFEKALAEEPQNTHILYNLGLAHYRLGQKGWAAACWRKALELRPDLSEASKSLAVLGPELPSAGGEADDDLLTQLQKQWAAPVSWPVYLLLLWMLLSVTGFLWLRYFAARKQLTDEDLEDPASSPVPTIAIVTTALAVLVVSLMALKFRDQRQPRATIVAEMSALRLSPDPEAQQLSEGLQGQQVELMKTYQDWAQVSLSSGMVGWMPKNTLFQTSGYPLW